MPSPTALKFTELYGRLTARRLFWNREEGATGKPDVVSPTRNLRENFVRSSFLIGRYDFSEGEEIVLRSQVTNDSVRVRVLKSDKRDLPVFSERESEAIAGKDPLYMTYLICRKFRIEELDYGITYIEHSAPHLVRLATNKYSSKYSSELARLERRLPCRKCYNWEP